MMIVWSTSPYIKLEAWSTSPIHEESSMEYLLHDDIYVEYLPYNVSVKYFPIIVVCSTSLMTIECGWQCGVPPST